MLVLVEDRPWEGSTTRLAELQEKVNLYLAFALDGQLAKLRPHTRGKPFELRIDCDVEPDPDTVAFIEEIRTAIIEYGTTISVNMR